MRGFRPRGDPLQHPAAHTRLLRPFSAPRPEFSTKVCDFRSFPSGKHVHSVRPDYRVNTCTPRVKLSGKHVHCTSSTDQVVRTDKYVQAGGLFILWTEQDGNRPTRRAIEGMSGGSGTTRAVFTEVFHLKRLLG